jgi:hypothetical protein
VVIHDDVEVACNCVVDTAILDAVEPAWLQNAKTLCDDLQGQKNGWVCVGVEEKRGR